MKREFLQNLKVGEEALSKEVIDAIMEENGRDIAKADALSLAAGDFERTQDRLAQSSVRWTHDWPVGKSMDLETPCLFKGFT